MALLDDVKNELRVSGTDHNTEITDLINAVKYEMESKGLDSTKIVDSDPLVKQAIMLYCKANFGYDDVNFAQLYQDRYEKTLNHMLLSGLYEVVEE